MYSKNFSLFYDRLMGDNSLMVDKTLQLVTDMLPQNAEILELGCGTGTVLRKLHMKGYRVFGLDNAEGMLHEARKKVPQAELYLADMTDFSIPKKFGGILCVFDSINHLTTFSLWRKLFRTVRRHLKEDGIFIFDMNTKRRHEALSSHPPYVTKLDKNTLSTAQVSRLNTELFEIKFQIFQNILGKNVEYYEERVQEASFPIEKIEKELLKSFFIVKKGDTYRKRISSKTGRLYFVCKRK